MFEEAKRSWGLAHAGQSIGGRGFDSISVAAEAARQALHEEDAGHRNAKAEATDRRFQFTAWVKTGVCPRGA